MIHLQYREDRPIRMGFHAHAEYEVYYFHGGKCNYLIGDKLWALRPGDMLLMHGMTPHCPNPDYSEPYVRSILHFDPSYIRGVWPSSSLLLEPFAELKTHRLHLTGRDREHVESELAAMHALQQAGTALAKDRFLLKVIGLLHDIYEWCRDPIRLAAEIPNDKQKHAQAVISYIEEHYDKDIRLDDLERALHLNKHYLARLFKEVTGMTIFKYLYHRRINQARVWMALERDMSVTEVCYRTGFKHVAHFSRVFKQLVGCAPDRYRKDIANR